MARFLIGDEVEEIYTSAGVMVDPAIGEAGDLDTALVVMRFKNGVIGTIDNSRKAALRIRPARGDSGQRGQDRDREPLSNEAVVSTGKSVYNDLPLNFFMDRYTESFALELEAFTEAVLEGKPDAGDRHRRPRPCGDGAGGAQVVRRAPAGETRGGGSLKRSMLVGHPDRRASVGAGGRADSGNRTADDAEVKG